MNAISVIHSFITQIPEETAAAGAKLSQLCAPGDCITLTGDLGAGKTAFARGFIQALCGSDTIVASPSFTLTQLYEVNRHSNPFTLTHADCYRLEHAEELSELGLEEAWESGILIVEWPQIAQAHLPKSRLEVSIAHGNSIDARIITLHGDDNWRKRLLSF